MALKSISALGYKVKDLDKTAAFYELLGMRAGKRTDDTYTVYVNWFSIEFQLGKPEPGNGQITLINVDGVDDFYKELTSKGIKAQGEPAEGNNKRREFTVSDPDGYKLVFFEKK